jgi:hypothetical protein
MDDYGDLSDKYKSWKNLDSYVNAHLYINECHKVLREPLSAVGVKREKDVGQ